MFGRGRLQSCYLKNSSVPGPAHLRSTCWVSGTALGTQQTQRCVSRARPEHQPFLAPYKKHIYRDNLKRALIYFKNQRSLVNFAFRW